MRQRITAFFKRLLLRFFPLKTPEILELIKKAPIGTDFTSFDKKLIESVLRFKDKIAREVMVPRVDLFCLPEDTPIKEAARLCDEEGYSRIPVYKDTIDSIIGVLMFKDLFTKFRASIGKKNPEEFLQAPIGALVKPVLYVPETKRIYALLQEFRRKQIHLAIVVDEYGGTAGVITIEDILEQIVGEIADEYDQEEELVTMEADGCWTVDARMSILDAEQLLGIKIPEEGDYDTIGGFVFHHAGTIPEKGFKIHHETFELEVLSSNDRRIEKVRIRLLNSPYAKRDR